MQPLALVYMAPTPVSIRENTAACNSSSAWRTASLSFPPSTSARKSSTGVVVPTLVTTLDSAASRSNASPSPPSSALRSGATKSLPPTDEGRPLPSLPRSLTSDTISNTLLTASLSSRAASASSGGGCSTASSIAVCSRGTGAPGSTHLWCSSSRAAWIEGLTVSSGRSISSSPSGIRSEARMSALAASYCSRVTVSSPASSKEGKVNMRASSRNGSTLKARASGVFASGSPTIGVSAPTCTLAPFLHTARTTATEPRRSIARTREDSAAMSGGDPGSASTMDVSLRNRWGPREAEGRKPSRRTPFSGE
mmetsp:Transcript_58263/g.185630  ORF Transcript_58263/g.185630 Transcript_58263/m.185630 type:complete len:309 (+) Transcript_58263:1175-2101(+)